MATGKTYGLTPQRVRPVVISQDEQRGAQSGDQIDRCYLAPPQISWHQIHECAGILTIDGSSIVIEFCEHIGPPILPDCVALTDCTNNSRGYAAETPFLNAVTLQDCTGTVIGFISPVPIASAFELVECGTNALIGYAKIHNCTYSDIPDTSLCHTLRYCNGQHIAMLRSSGVHDVRYCNGQLLGYLGDGFLDCTGEIIEFVTCSGGPSATCHTIISGCASSPGFFMTFATPNTHQLTYCTGASLGYISSTPISGGHTLVRCTGALIGYAPATCA